MLPEIGSGIVTLSVGCLTSKRPGGTIMEWAELMSTDRFRDPETDPTPDKFPDYMRSAFSKDADRIIFSSAFRRLQDKTQVHTFPDTDYVRTRLTHSLEVSSAKGLVFKRSGRSNCPAATDRSGQDAHEKSTIQTDVNQRGGFLKPIQRWLPTGSGNAAPLAVRPASSSHRAHRRGRLRFQGAGPRRHRRRTTRSLMRPAVRRSGCRR